MRGCVGLAIATCFATATQAQIVENVDFVGQYSWVEDVEDFGGFSGLEIGADGLTFQSVSDRGWHATGQLERDAETGRITGVAEFNWYKMLDTDGDPLFSYLDDAEGLAVTDDGVAYVSFEGEHRVRRYDAPGTAATAIGAHADFADMQNNSALEVLAVDPHDNLLTLPERSGVLTRPFPVYRFKDGWDQPFSIRRDSPFLPVGADFGPDGKFYLLERHLNGIFGFQTRIRRFDYAESGFSNEEEVLESGSGRHDNMEGLAVWRDAGGDIRLTMISDDNYRSFQRTEFVEYRIRQ